MKIAFAYPPYTKNGHYPNLPQNRQFIYTASNEVRLYPVVMATAASWLKKNGHQVLWLDGITRRLATVEFRRCLREFKPELIVLETKTPVMTRVWAEVHRLKKENPEVKVVLVGDHATMFPQESFNRCQVDWVVAGGDYDFGLVGLVDHLVTGAKKPAGVFYRTKRGVNSVGVFKRQSLSNLPQIDRELTRWRDYGEAYLFQPCAYMMSGRGCAITKKNCGACTFCVWEHALWGCQARFRTPEAVGREVAELYRLGAKEVFDDAESGALFDTDWLTRFGKVLKKEGVLGKVVISSNARADQLTKARCRQLKKLGYRLLKVGLESGNDETLKRINKKETIAQIKQGIKNAKDAGLRVMMTIMVGYPWEKEAEIKKTYRVARELLDYKQRAGDCLQASVVVPYPGTPLWRQARTNGWLLVAEDDYAAFDMTKIILASPVPPRSWCQRIWGLQSRPQFIVRSGLTVRNPEEFWVLMRGARSLVGHLVDFKKA